MPKRMSRAEWESFLRDRRVGILATLSKGGAPVLTPIWYLYRDGRILIRTAHASVKARNIARDPRVNLCVQDEHPPYRSVSIQGTASLESAEEGLDSAIARRYLGTLAGATYLRTARAAAEEGQEVTIAITPERVVTQDYTPETPLTGRLWLLAKRVVPWV